MIERWLAERREGQVQDGADIRAFVEALVREEITRAQAAAWLSFVYLRGMTPAETAALTLAMRDSGEVMRWPSEGGALIDKHSTGGVGDKVSLVLAPLWAALGYRVPMISGRGLEITGGTLDKLESIPGYRCDLETDELQRQLQEVGCFISGQTGDLAPADKILYALRNETCTVSSIPLITGSILSKKLAEGVDRLVLDVKFGSGAFMKTREQALQLAKSMEDVGREGGLEIAVHVSDMNQPLGRAIGNSLEVAEAIETLQGEGPADLRALVLKLSGEPERGARALDSGEAYARFEEMVRAQGGQLSEPLRGQDAKTHTLEAPHSGTLASWDAWCLGRASFLLGAGRAREQDPVHHGVGLKLHVQSGERVERGQPLISLHHAELNLDEAIALVERGCTLKEA